MKVKQQPSDFRVEELTSFAPGATGEFAFYRLDKVGWTTPDALSAVRRRWQIEADRLNYGGLKDRHAETTQYLTIYRGPRRDLTHERVRVTYLGQATGPYGSHHISANRFRIVLRHVTPTQASAIIDASKTLELAGVPNYFDDQRFGSVGDGGEFVAREMVRGNFEHALRLALAAPYEFDKADQKLEKEILNRLWGDWPACKAALPRGHARSLVDYLVSHPTDFKGAVARLRPELGGLYLSAYQSHLWNRLLDRRLREIFPANALGEVELKLGRFAIPIAAGPPGWDEQLLPLPSARLKPDPTADWLPALTAILADHDLTLDRLKIPGLQKPFFSKGDRNAGVRPIGMTATIGDDDLNRGKKLVALSFDLPRGCYATMIVKRLTAIGEM